MQAALALLGTLRATGTSALVTFDGSTEHKDHFTRFSARLEQGDIVSVSSLLKLKGTNHSLSL
jgi:hypothetical protein